MTAGQKEIIIRKITEKENFPLARNEANQIFRSESVDDCFNYALEFFQSDNTQIQTLGVFLLGLVADKRPEALRFLKETVSQKEDWRVQEILAMAFDSFCKSSGYEQSLPTIKEWLGSNIPNVRRAVTEGLRIWTGRPYFKEHPEIAVSLLSELKQDESEYVRKSVGNALRDISKKYPALITEELAKWNTSTRQVNQVYKLACKFIKNMGDGKNESKQSI